MYSRRQWDGLIKHWKRAIHQFAGGDSEKSSETASASSDNFSWADDVEEEEKIAEELLNNEEGKLQVFCISLVGVCIPSPTSW